MPRLARARSSGPPAGASGTIRRAPARARGGAALLAHPDTRLVTVTGAGGTGKTRLALEVAARVERDLGIPAFFVELAPLAEPALMLAELARALGSRTRRPHVCPRARRHSFVTGLCCCSWTTSSTSSRRHRRRQATRRRPRLSARRPAGGRSTSGPNRATNSTRSAPRTPAPCSSNAPARSAAPSSRRQRWKPSVDASIGCRSRSSSRPHAPISSPRSRSLPVSTNASVSSARAPATCRLVSARCGRLSTGAIDSSATRNRSSLPVLPSSRVDARTRGRGAGV